MAEYATDLSHLKGWPHGYGMARREAAAQVRFISAEELPPDCREDLIDALMAGEAEHVYAPGGVNFLSGEIVIAHFHNVVMTVPGWVNSTMRVADWVALRRDGLSHAEIRQVMIDRTLAQAEANARAYEARQAAEQATREVR